MKAYRVSYIILTDDDTPTCDVTRMGKEAFRFMQEEHQVGGYLSSVTPVPPTTVVPSAPEPRASRK